MIDDSELVHLYNEEDNQVVQFIEYKRLTVQGQIYALLQPEDDLDQLVAFRIDEAAGEDGEDIYIYVVDSDELDAVDEAWQKLHS
jgi:Spy/CpxP family protein refolding chaperone